MPYLSPHDPAIDPEQAARDSLSPEEMQALMTKVREELLRAYTERSGTGDEQPSDLEDERQD